MTDIPELIESALRESSVEFEVVGDGQFVVNLPGTRRLKTACWLTVGNHALTIEAFVVRMPDENAEQVYRYLLEHNARMYVVAWSIDDNGDIYLTGRVPLSCVTAEEIDRILGRRPGIRRRLVQPLAATGIRLVHPSRVGLAGEEGRVAGEPGRVRRLRSAPPTDGRVRFSAGRLTVAFAHDGIRNGCVSKTAVLSYIDTLP